MNGEEIKNTAFFKNISKASNSERGDIFDKYSSEIEKRMGVKLVKHSYAELGRIKTDNPMISYQENWGSFSGPFIGLMEFIPQ